MRLSAACPAAVKSGRLEKGQSKIKFLLLGQQDLSSSPHGGGVRISDGTGETNLGVRGEVLLRVLQHCQQGWHIHRLEEGKEEEEHSIAD